MFQGESSFRQAKMPHVHDNADSPNLLCYNPARALIHRIPAVLLGLIPYRIRALRLPLWSCLGFIRDSELSTIRINYYTLFWPQDLLLLHNSLSIFVFDTITRWSTQRPKRLLFAVFSRSFHLQLLAHSNLSNTQSITTIAVPRRI